jgi:glycosyltransferase involved in cell wall biosynthesis
MITTISDYTASVVRRHLRTGDTPVETVYLGNPLETTDTVTAAPAHAALRGVAGAPFFVFVGVLHPKKNVHVLVPLLREFPEHRLVLAGPNGGAYAAQVRDAARAQGVADRVLMPGPVDEATKRWLYVHGEGLLFPSLTEGFGLPVVEAMSLGKPVFLSRLSSLPEVGGPEAFYFDSFEAPHMAAVVSNGLQAFADDPNRAERSRSWAARFSWGRAAERYWMLYKDLSTQPARRR